MYNFWTEIGLDNTGIMDELVFWWCQIRLWCGKKFNHTSWVEVITGSWDDLKLLFASKCDFKNSLCQKDARIL